MKFPIGPGLLREHRRQLPQRLPDLTDPFPRVAREQRISRNRRVRPDVEIRQRRSARAPAAAVVDERLAREKGGVAPEQGGERT